MKQPASRDGEFANLVAFVDNAQYDDLPPQALRAAERAWLNIVGCHIGGSRHDTVEVAARALLRLGGAGEALVIGRGQRTDMLTAALLNGLSSAAYSFDDTHALTILHPTGAVASALLALASEHRISGRQFLLALVLGIEVASRLSKAVSVHPASADIGWSQTGIAAGMGAAAASAKVLGLDVDGITRAIGLAALQASGMRVAHGTMGSTYLCGHAAQSGLRAALLASEGMTSPADPIGANYGFASLHAHRAHLAHLTDSLGRAFEVEELGFKPYPCGVVIHPAIDAALEARHRIRIDAARIVELEFRLHPSAMALGYRRQPANMAEAKVSLFHWIAAALVFGRASLAEGQTAAIDDPEVVRLRSLIEVQSDEQIPPQSAEMSLTASDGACHQIRIDDCKGSVRNPMSDADLEEKLAGQLLQHVDHGRIGFVISRCRQLAEVDDMKKLIADLA